MQLLARTFATESGFNPFERRWIIQEQHRNKTWTKPVWLIYDALDLVSVLGIARSLAVCHPYDIRVVDAATETVVLFQVTHAPEKSQSTFNAD